MPGRYYDYRSKPLLIVDSLRVAHAFACLPASPPPPSPVLRRPLHLDASRQAWGNLGAVHMHEGNWASATACFSEGLKQMPTNWRMWENQAEALLRLGRWGYKHINSATYCRVTICLFVGGGGVVAPQKIYLDLVKMLPTRGTVKSTSQTRQTPTSSVVCGENIHETLCWQCLHKMHPLVATLAGFPTQFWHCCRPFDWLVDLGGQPHTCARHAVVM